MSITEFRIAPFLVFGVFVVVVLAGTFALGHLTGRWAVHRHYAQFAFDPGTADKQTKLGEFLISKSSRVRENEYVELRTAIERHREQAPAEQRAGLDEALRVMRERWEEQAKKRPTVEHIAEGK